MHLHVPLEAHHCRTVAAAPHYSATTRLECCDVCEPFDVLQRLHFFQQLRIVQPSIIGSIGCSRRWVCMWGA
jgi:hypothetical protein